MVQRRLKNLARQDGLLGEQNAGVELLDFILDVGGIGQTAALHALQALDEGAGNIGETASLN